jgi:hypothetical protein
MCTGTVWDTRISLPIVNRVFTVPYVDIVTVLAKAGAKVLSFTKGFEISSVGRKSPPMGARPPIV